MKLKSTKMEESNITSNEDIDESCYIVEIPPEIIEINDTIDEQDIHNETKDISDESKAFNLENETADDYKVIDETGFTSNENDTIIDNGHSVSTSEDPVSFN